MNCTWTKWNVLYCCTDKLYYNCVSVYDPRPPFLSNIFIMIFIFWFLFISELFYNLVCSIGVINYNKCRCRIHTDKYLAKWLLATYFLLCRDLGVFIFPPLLADFKIGTGSPPCGQSYIWLMSPLFFYLNSFLITCSDILKKEG